MPSTYSHNNFVYSKDFKEHNYAVAVIKNQERSSVFLCNLIGSWYYCPHDYVAKISHISCKRFCVNIAQRSTARFFILPLCGKISPTLLLLLQNKCLIFFLRCWKHDKLNAIGRRYGWREGGDDLKNAPSPLFSLFSCSSCRCKKALANLVEFDDSLVAQIFRSVVNILQLNFPIYHVLNCHLN